jgi:predicted oxidoreductase
MKTIRIPHTDLEASQIAYGCMLIGGEWNRERFSQQTQRDATRVVRTALDEGINFFDHADIYTYGKSEEVFSAIWQDIPGLREKIILQSKCGIRFPGDPDEDAPHRFDFSYEHIIESVDGSLQRLKTDYLDILLLHRPDPLVEPEEVAHAFDDLRASGKVRFFGVSNHTAAQIALLRRYVEQPLVCNQVELNVIHTHLLDEGIQFNQDNPPTPVRGDGTLEYCRLHDILIQAWAPLANGVVTGKVVELPTQALKDVTTLVAQLAQEKKVSPEAILIAWLMRLPFDVQPIIGTTKPERLTASCQANEIELSRYDWYRLFTAGRGSKLP